MRCPFCGREYITQDEVTNCIVSHARETQKEQIDQLQRQNIMLMASQLTMASLGTHTSAHDVVERFGEIYELLENITGKPDVVKEIEKWLEHKEKGTGEQPQ